MAHANRVDDAEDEGEEKEAEEDGQQHFLKQGSLRIRERLDEVQNETPEPTLLLVFIGLVPSIFTPALFCAEGTCNMLCLTLTLFLPKVLFTWRHFRLGVFCHFIEILSSCICPKQAI